MYFLSRYWTFIRVFVTKPNARIHFSFKIFVVGIVRLGHIRQGATLVWVHEHSVLKPLFHKAWFTHSLGSVLVWCKSRVILKQNLINSSRNWDYSHQSIPKDHFLQVSQTHKKSFLSFHIINLGIVVPAKPALFAVHLLYFVSLRTCNSEKWTSTSLDFAFLYLHFAPISDISSQHKQQL